ncbi:hypothetical protein GQ53DRAFT_823058 [Thozetella sp. PMI_491]|nr:hypothetical protein GQ53DRAFT_823058 [Thozetella sp. PMI_491]
MASSIEGLPVELLRAITDGLARADLAHLIRCSRALHRSLEATLYQRDSGASNAMQWACQNGHIGTIRLAVAHGAQESTFEVGWPSGRERPVRGSTLGLAAKKNHLNAFKTLLELGANIRGLDPRQIAALLRRLYSPGREAFLRLFLEARLGLQMPCRSCEKQYNVGTGLSLVSILRPEISRGLVELMVENGADPNTIAHSKRSSPISPLSRAVQEYQMPLFDLLLEKGATIDGLDIPFPPDYPTHIPIFAAAQQVGKGNDMLMLKKCLDHGATINRRHPAKHHGQKGCVYNFYMTPLFVYLDSITSWEPVPGLDPAEVIETFLEHGAELHCEHSEQGSSAIKCAEAPSAIELLTDRWGYGYLALHEFLSVIKLLAKRGSLGSHSREATRRLDSHLSSQDETHKRLLDLVVKGPLSTEESQELKNSILHCYVTDVGLSGQDIGDKERNKVVQLTEEGGDLNARFGYMTQTCLGHLTRGHREDEQGYWIHYRSPTHKTNKTIRAERIKFMTFLSDLGATT